MGHDQIERISKRKLGIFMSGKPFEHGRWSVHENRGPGGPIGYIVDGVGEEVRPGAGAFQINDGVLFDPQGKRLGYLAALEDSWVVNLGDYEIGHVLRRAVR
jgi:sugar lactone lactonase YvrE